MAEYEVGGSVYELPDGLPPDKIRSVLTKLAQKEKGSPLGQATKAFGQGVNVGLADFAGAPVDLVTGGLNLGARALDLPEIETPMGGSQHLKQLLGSEGPRVPEAPVQLPGMTYGNIEDVPERFRPVARAGEVVGASAPLAAMPLAAARTLGTRPAQGLTAPIVEGARNAPATFAAAEAASAGGAAIGSGIAEAVDPGDPLTRMGAEVAGGALSPLALLANSSRGITQSIRVALGSLTKPGRERQAAGRIQEMVGSLGETPTDVATRLEAPSVAPLTSGQKSLSPALLALEKKLVSESAKFGLDIQAQTKQSIDEVNAALRDLAGSGDPEALKTLASARQDYWNALMDSYTQLAAQKGTKAAESILPSGVRADENIKARVLIENALKDARTEERRLWGGVDKNIEIEKPQNLADAYDEATGDLLPGEGLNVSGFIKESIKKWTKPPKKKPKKPPRLPTSGDLLRLRGRILAEQRKIRGSQAPDWDLHRRLDNIQISIVDDLVEADSGAEVARTFSRQLHDRFSRSPAGKALGRDVTGAEKIPPELTLEKTIASGGGPSRAVAARQIEEAVEPFGELPATQRPMEMRQAQEQVIRDMASVSMDSATGMINPTALARIRDSNKALLSRFPNLSKTLESAETATRVYRGRIKKLSLKDKQVRQNAAFSKVLKFEDPKRVISVALDSKTPSADLDSIFRLAKSDAARKGASRVFIDTILDRAISPGSGLTSGKFLQEIYQHADLAVKRGILTRGDIKRLERVAEEATKLETAMKFSGQFDQIVGDTNDLFDLLVRITGANIGASSAIAKSSGAGLVTAGYGSRAARKWAEKIPQNRVKDVMAEAVKNPKFMAELLRKQPPLARSLPKDKRLNAYLLQLGIPGSEE